MLWQVRAVLEDRPGSLAALAAGCGARSVNILGLQIFPAPDGRVVDELVLHTPSGWSAADVGRLVGRAGVEAPEVAECSPHALEDQPVRYVRAAQAIIADPDRLEEQLCDLLDAAPVATRRGGALVLDDGNGPPVRLRRRTPFTDTELARASALRQLAVTTAPGRWSPPPSADEEPELRFGTVEDTQAVIAMHERCSAESVYRRYHAPLPRPTPRLARALLEPPGGFSLVLAVGDAVVALGLLAPGPDGAELGLLVEDGRQRRGHGARLTRALVEEAARRGLDSVVCMVQADNDAVLATVRRAGLRAHVARVDGCTRYRIPLPKSRGTSPLVALLHARPELRGTYAPADLVDQAVRGGA
jgi:ribosomal protein S18 acetylase RimI-like enzyme